MSKLIRLMAGNAKMGKVLNVSLPPCASCDTSLPCFQGGRKTCYSLKFYTLRLNVRKAWDANWLLWQTSPMMYFHEIEEAVRRRKPDMFRFHVGGDIPDQLYLNHMIELSAAMPETKFMAFTKRYDWAWEARKRLPFNLQLVLSAWPGVTIPGKYKRRFPIAWMRDQKAPDKRIPKHAFKCDGGCSTCGMCWALKPGQAVVFNKH